MATKALTSVGQRASRSRAYASVASGRGRDWREVLLSQDADAIWRKLYALVRSNIPDKPSEQERITQELFLFLVSTGRVNMYLEEDYSSDAIRLDLISLLTT